MAESCDILVVGGGPAGAVAAALLARAGWRVVVCEGKVFPREKVCGEFMGVRVRPVLRELELLEKFESVAGPAVSHVVAHAASGESVAGALPGDGARAVSRGVLDEMLLTRARQLGA